MRDVQKSRRLPRGFPDVLQFGGQPTQPTVRPFSARNFERMPQTAAQPRDNRMAAAVVQEELLRVAAVHDEADAHRLEGPTWPR